MDFSLQQCELFGGQEQDSPSGKTSPESSVTTKGEALLRWLERWQGYTLTYRKVDGETPVFSSGQTPLSSGQFWMRNSSEFRSGAVASSLSEILETGPVERRYFLSPKACKGILRRAEKRGKALPEHLNAALESVATQTHQTETGGGLPLRMNYVPPSPVPVEVSNGGGTVEGKTPLSQLDGGGNNTSGPIEVATACNAHGGSGRIVPVAYRTNAAGQVDNQGDISAALTSQTDPCTQFLAYAIQERAVCENSSAGPDGVGIRTDDQACTVEARQVPQAVAFESRFARNGRGAPSEIVPPLKAQSGGSGKGDGSPLTMQGMAVRRLTPRECERLQGVPDDYTKIPHPKYINKGDKFGTHEKFLADGPRYKMLGNGFAVPVVRWIGERLAKAVK